MGLTMLDQVFEPSASPVTAGEYDRPAKMPHQSRSAVIASHGIVATSQPLAAQVGLDILKAGGNAIDAAIATDAMMGLVEPMSCGIGGDLFCIYWDAKTQKLYGLNASGRSPYALNRDVFKTEGTQGNSDQRNPVVVGAGMCRRLGPIEQAVRHDAPLEALGTRHPIRGRRLSGQPR